MKDQNKTNSGFLLIDKISGITSFKVVHQLRKITNIRKIGHAGTLDPFATGLLIIAITREATKQIDSFLKLDKVYEAEFCLGATTETLDPEGEIIFDKNLQPSTITPEKIKEQLSHFIGKINQTPPTFSAIKINGQRAYDLARKGLAPEMKSREIEIFDFTLENLYIKDNVVFVNFIIHCGSGTYIRSLARDLAKALNTTGYCTALRRTKIGSYSIENAHKLSELNSENWHNYLFSPTKKS